VPELEVRRPSVVQLRELRKRWGSLAPRAREELFKAALKEFRIRHLDQMHDLVTEMHVKRAERIARELEATDNPLTKELLMRQVETWLRQVERELEG
jgi:hypothetical protein